jgi:hypothetical protein
MFAKPTSTWLIKGGTGGISAVGSSCLFRFLLPLLGWMNALRCWPSGDRRLEIRENKVYNKRKGERVRLHRNP